MRPYFKKQQNKTNNEKARGENPDKVTTSHRTNLPCLCDRGVSGSLGRSLQPSVHPPLGSGPHSTPIMLVCSGSPGPESHPHPHPLQRGVAGGEMRAHTAGLHSTTTAELFPLQDTVRCMLKRKPPGRSGQPWRSSREQQYGSKVWLQGRNSVFFPALLSSQPRAPPHPGREQSEADLPPAQIPEVSSRFCYSAVCSPGLSCDSPQESTNMCTTYRQGQCHPKGSCELTSPTHCRNFLEHLQSALQLLH